MTDLRPFGDFLLTPLKYTWALPWTLFGIASGLLILISGGRAQFGPGVIEFWGGKATRLIRWLPMSGNAVAITFGHVILARSFEDLDCARDHELIHVRQYERWGPFFIPAYLFWSLLLWVRGKGAYYDNPFEQEAYGTRDSFGTQGPAWLRRGTFVAFAGVIAGLAATLFSRLSWICELATHFRVFYLIALATIATAWWIRGRFWRAVLAGAIAAAFTISLVPFYTRAPTAAGENATTLRILSVNVLSQNTNHDAVLQLVRTESPDVLLAMEVNENWRRGLSELTDTYPYHKVLARPDNFGIALYSRLPLDHLTLVPLGESGVPCLLAKTSFGKATLTILGVHLLPPMGARRSEERNQGLDTLARVAAESPGEVMVIGDLNCTSWSPFFHDFIVAAKLRDSRLGYGLQPTWPTHPMPLLPIDHCLVSDGIHVQARRVGPDIGSDHLPVIVDLCESSR